MEKEKDVNVIFIPDVYAGSVAVIKDGVGVLPTGIESKIIELVKPMCRQCKLCSGAISIEDPGNTGLLKTANGKYVSEGKCYLLGKSFKVER